MTTKNKSKTTKTQDAPQVYVHQPRLTALAEGVTLQGQRVKTAADTVIAPVTECGPNRMGVSAVAIKQHTLTPDVWGRPLNGANAEYTSRPKSLDMALAHLNGTPADCKTLATLAVEKFGGAPAGEKGSPHNATSNHMLARVQQGRAVRVGNGQYALAPHFRAEAAAAPAKGKGRGRGKGK